MNILDVLIVIAFLGLFALGFLAGIPRSLIWFLSLIAGLVGASVFYGALRDLLLRRYETLEPAIADLIAFVAVVAIVAVAVGYLLLRSYRVARLRTRLTFETRGGLLAVLLLVAVAFLVATTTTVVTVQALQATARELPPDTTLVWVHGQFQESVLTGAVTRVSPIVYRTVDLLTPGDAPELLRASGAGGDAAGG